ncbi:hypothetical protein CPT76_34700 [Paenibacillus sp. AR247]|nr:hypothetical protein CPT76_34700 [Paenibacillus sp. AR247]
MIELALAFTDKDGTYSEHAAAALASVFRNTSSELQVHILHDDSLLEENRNKLAQLAADFKHPIHFYPVTLPVEMMNVLSGTGSIDRWTWGSLYRLLLPAVVPAERVIYLDCDVMVNMDITELWEIDLNGGYLGAIHDQGIHGIAEVVAVQGLNPETYFNSGVLVFDLNAIRQHVTWFEEILNFFRAFPGTSMPDQDCLNHVFGGNCLLLDQRFNWFYNLQPAAAASPASLRCAAAPAESMPCTFRASAAASICNGRLKKNANNLRPSGGGCALFFNVNVVSGAPSGQHIDDGHDQQDRGRGRPAAAQVMDKSNQQRAYSGQQVPDRLGHTGQFRSLFGPAGAEHEEHRYEAEGRTGADSDQYDRDRNDRVPSAKQ